MRVALISGLTSLMVLIVGGGVGFLFLQLYNANVFSAEVHNARTEIERLEAYITDLEGDIAIVRLAGDLRREQLQTSLDDERDINLGLDVKVKDLTDQNMVLQKEVDNLQSHNSRLIGSNNEIQRNYNVLKAAQGDLTQVRDRERAILNQIDYLESEIRRLKEQRTPLILPYGAVYTIGFSCTGSMYPAFTCMDMGTWLSDFKPSDIVVGATIAFDPDCWESAPDNRYTAHRVMEIKIENGVYYFWPKGDFNREADGCWVHQDNVKDYLVGLEKDVRPKNSYLQSQVIASKVAYEDALEAYRWDGSRDAYNRLQSASRLYECWFRNAKESEYPGHIPNQSCATP